MAVTALATGAIVGYLVATHDDKSGETKLQVIEKMSALMLEGRVYENEMTMTENNPQRLHDKKTMVSDVIVYVSVNAMVFGNESNQRFPVAAGGSFSVRECDLSTLWFRNAVVGSNGKINIIGTRR